MELTMKSQIKEATIDRAIRVLLVDDQTIIGESVRRMLATETDIELHFCQDPLKALEMARAVRPTVILQDLVMPDVDGLMLVKFFRVNPLTRETPMIVLSSKEEAAVKAQAFALGANDYLVKLPDKVELIARIRYHSRAYLTLLERNEAARLLQESQRLLAQEIRRAAEYVQSLLPAKLKAPVRTDWRFVPSMHLGGDMFGHHWLDPDHLAIYLLDVSGHGVGSSLMAVSAMNVLAGQSLPNTDFRDPVAVLKGLNQIFQMEKHNEKYFTLWYGVYRRASRELVFGNAGHPATLLFTGPSEDQARRQELASHGFAIGMVPEFEYESEVVKLDAYARLLIYSDGVFEIELPQGGMWTFEEFVEHVSGLSPAGGSIIDQLLAHVRALHGSETLGDDFSMVEIHF
ncbi:fused response regulator/phosphatase [Gemmata palustris]|nr:fused response regulator/phosphatase [Gemmata palustris]